MGRWGKDKYLHPQTGRKVRSDLHFFSFFLRPTVKKKAFPKENTQHLISVLFFWDKFTKAQSNPNRSLMVKQSTHSESGHLTVSFKTAKARIKKENKTEPSTDRL